MFCHHPPLLGMHMGLVITHHRLHPQQHMQIELLDTQAMENTETESDGNYVNDAIDEKYVNYVHYASDTNNANDVYL